MKEICWVVLFFSLIEAGAFAFFPKLMEYGNRAAIKSLT